MLNMEEQSKIANALREQKYGIPEAALDDVVIAHAEAHGWQGFMNNWSGGDGKQRLSARAGVLLPLFRVRRYLAYRALPSAEKIALHIKLEAAARKAAAPDGYYAFSHVYEDAEGWTCALFVLRD